jgi:Na+/melibiose symporter-like transporter
MVFCWAMAAGFIMLGLLLLAIFVEGGPAISGLGIVGGPLCLIFAGMLVKAGFNIRRRMRDSRAENETESHGT